MRFTNRIKLLAFLLCFIVNANAANLQAIQNQINNSSPGSIIHVNAGTYKGNLEIRNSVNLICQQGAIFDANHNGSAIRVYAENVSIENCRIINYGDDLTAMDAAIFSERTATGLIVKNNSIHGDAFGIWLDSTNHVLISNNEIQGNNKIRSQDRGNGIHLFNVKHTKVEENKIWHTRDGIYIDTSNHNELIGNEIYDLRYGVHYMYSFSNRVENNYTHGTRTGYALMQSKYLTVINNRSENDTNYGILMNFIASSTISGNQVTNVKQLQGPGGSSVVKGGEGKALFIYNAPFNDINNNLLTQSDLGIHLTAGSEGNKIHNNYFVRNRQQVKYVANREVEWSFEGRGNFWSDYQGWDRNSDNIGDESFEPNDGIDKVLWKYPSANVLINSPSIQTLRWVQKTFPVLKSPGVKDSYPLMRNEFKSTKS